MVQLGLVEPFEKGLAKTHCLVYDSFNHITKGRRKMPNTARTEKSHRLDHSAMAESSARKSLRNLKLTANNQKAVRELLSSLTATDDLVEGFFQDCAELNPYTALMILEGYEQDGFYKIGTSSALHRLLKTFIEETQTPVVNHDFTTPVWAVTPEKMKKIRDRQQMEKVEMPFKTEDIVEEEKPRQCVIIQFPGLKR